MSARGPSRRQLLRGAAIDTDSSGHHRKIYDLAERLIRRSHDADFAMILGGDFRRPIGAVWTRPQQRPVEGERGTTE